MSKIRVHISSTVGSPIHETPGAGLPVLRSTPERADQGRSGWPVGWGRVDQTLTEDGREIEALVLMSEPALAGMDVDAWPVAVLQLTDPATDELLCVQEDENFMDLVDEADLPRWNAAPGTWAAALDRMDPNHAHVVAGCRSRAEANHLADEARQSYLRSTGCLDG
jgi:inorganic pyrophosphatase